MHSWRPNKALAIWVLDKTKKGVGMRYFLIPKERRTDREEKKKEEELQKGMDSILSRLLWNLV